MNDTLIKEACLSNDRFADHENRLAVLEDDEKVGNILIILQKIEQRLIGGLDNDSPGLIPEFNQTKKDVDEIKVHLGTIEASIKKIEEGLTPTKNIVEDIKDLKKEVKMLSMHRYILYGGILVLYYLLSHPEMVKSLLGIKTP